MSRSTIAAGLRYLHGVAAARQYREDSDERLLHAFVSHRDDSAFAVLVRRHGPMVLHVCRRVLGQEQDAEDVFQATFLVLARSAAKLRKKTALASFLHGTAYRLALSAKRAAARRRKHEGQAPARPSIDPAADLSWGEVRALLDEEIVRLPEKYRSVFILCCLEETSRAEAAQRLGLKEGTVSSRLAMARQRLQRRLSRRGVELTAVLTAATLAAQPTSALPPVLVSSILKAALSKEMAGLVSARVAELVNSAASRSIRCKIAVFLALAAGVVAVGAASRAVLRPEPPTPPADPPRVETPQAVAQKLADTVTVRGRVLGPDGKPIEGARLYWPRMPKTPPRSEEDIQFPQRAKTDADGRFHFELPRSDVDPALPCALVAAADGFGMDWSELAKDGSRTDLTLRLVKDQPIEGRIISTEGKPLAGITVRAIAVCKPRGGLDDFLALWKQHWSRALQQHSSTPQSMLLPSDEKSTQAVTDKDGRFRIRGVGAERLVLLRLRGARVSQAMLWVITRAGFDPASVNKNVLKGMDVDERRLRQAHLLYGPMIEYVAPAGRRIEGAVREVGTGKPVPSFVISFGAGIEGAHAVADTDGRYKLEDLPKINQYVLVASPPANSSWLPAVARVQDKEALQPITVDFTVARGIVVKGRVIDRKTGKGVRGGLHFVPLPGNQFAGKPGYDSYKNGDLLANSEVGSDGRFRLAVIPGPIVLMFQASGVRETANGGLRLNPYKCAEFDAKDRERFNIVERDDRFLTARDNRFESLSFENAVKVLDLAPDAATAQCDLYLERGATRTIRIEDNEGKPLTGTTVAGVTVFGRRNYTIEDATCTIFALDPKKPRRLLFLHVKRNLAGTLILRGDEKEPVVVRLGQTGAVTGRVLGSDGQPLAGADVNLILSDMAGFELYREARNYPTVRVGVRTDKDGRFRLEGIVPEMKFRLGIVQGRTYFVGEPLVGVKQVKRGETLDLGDLRVKPAS